MEQGDQEGMQTFDSVIENLIRTSVLTREDALPYATNQNNLILRLADMADAPKPQSAEPAASQDGSMLDMIER